MVMVALCALILGLAPVCRDYLFMWSVLSDVKNGIPRYSPEGYARLGPRATQALREALRSNKKPARLAAARSLGNIGRDSRPAISALAGPAIPDLIDAALHDPDREVRMYAIVAIGQIGPVAGDGVGPFIGLLEHEEDSQIVLVTLDALGLIGPRARPALPLLGAIIRNPNHYARSFAARAMCRIAPEGRAEASVLVPTLIDQCAKSNDSRSRAWAAEVLAAIGPAAGDAVPALQAAARDKDQDVRQAASQALEAIKGAPSGNAAQE